MLVRHRALEVAQSQVGVLETGANRGPRVDVYQRADDLPGEGYPWCASFIQWCFVRAGRPLATKTPSVGFLLDWARKEGYVVNRPLKGDLVCFYWGSDSWPDHIGFVEKVIKLGPVWGLRTIEGNTSPNTSASDPGSGRDGVYRRVRYGRRLSFIRIPGSIDVYDLKVNGKLVVRNQVLPGPLFRRALNALRKARSVEIVRR